MKISIITVAFNAKETIQDTIESVLSQNYKNIEIIVIDGNSTDGTVEIIKNYGKQITQFVSEPDNGIYDAMNKGITLATGDIIGILNADDFYIDNQVIEKIANVFQQEKVDSVFADLVYIKNNNVAKIIRKYDSSSFHPDKFAYGKMPAHPTFFVRKQIYQKYGLFRTDLKIAADFDILVRFLYVHKISYYYLPQVVIKMRTGGVSTSFNSIWINTIEILSVCRDNNIKTNLLKILSRYRQKISELLTNILSKKNI